MKPATLSLYFYVVAAIVLTVGGIYRNDSVLLIGAAIMFAIADIHRDLIRHMKGKD